MDLRLFKRAILPLSLLLLLFLFVRECVPVPIADLRLSTVARMPASALPSSSGMRETLARRGEHVWRVSLVGNAGWIKEVRQHNLNSYTVIVRCDDRNRSLFSLGPYVGQVAVTDYGETFRDYRPKSGTVRYDIYLPETERYRSVRDFNEPMPSYDLEKQRMSVCIRIAGGAMHGAYDSSNEVRVEVGNVL